MNTNTVNKNLTKSVISGMVAGLGGGVVFGMMMAMMDMLPMVAGLVGSQSVLVGGIVHMAISAVIGAFYGGVLNLGRIQLNWRNALISGMLNGVVWWVLGALILMPLGLGMTEMLFQIGTTQWLSLMGHLIYGLVTAVVLVLISRRK
jgi:uncharacterized membrane protein YagU involved in acid resistance